MNKKTENSLLLLFVCLLLIFFIVMPIKLSENNIFLGGDAVGSAGTIEQVFLKIRKGQDSLLNVFLYKGITLNEINWPDGFYIVPNIATGINVVLRFFFPDEISAYTAVLILFEMLNILSMFFILKKVLNINFFLSVFFSILTIFFPYFYYKLHHQSMVAFWQELFLIYFVLCFIEKPGIKYFFYIIIFIFINIFFNIQTCYFLFLSFFPALILALIFKMKNLQQNKKEYFKKFFIYSIIILICGIFIFYLSPYSEQNFLFEKQNIKKILPERDKTEIKVWQVPICFLFLPTDNNILFGDITGKRFTSKWGYHEKAIYLGISFLINFFILFIILFKKMKVETIKEQILKYNFQNLFLITGFFIFLFSVFWALAPALHFQNFLYLLNKSARVYGRSIALGIIFWVIIFAFLLNYLLKYKLIKYNLAILLIIFILLDIFPKSFKFLTLRLEKCPEEYSFLSKVAKEREKNC